MCWVITQPGKSFIGCADVCNTPGTNDPTAFNDHSTYIQYNIAFNGAQTVNTLWACKV